MEKVQTVPHGGDGLKIVETRTSEKKRIVGVIGVWAGRGDDGIGADDEGKRGT